MRAHVARAGAVGRRLKILSLQAVEKEALEKLRKDFEADQTLAQRHQREFEAAVQKVSPHISHSLMAE